MKNLLTIAFVFCGVLSTRLYLKADTGYIYQFAPAILFIVVALFVALLSGITLKVGRMAIFALLSMVTYLLMYFATFFSGGFALFVGLVTGALGAFSVLRLGNRLITPMAYDAVYVLVAGAIPFFLNDLLYFTGVLDPFWKFCKVDTGTGLESSFALVFFFWQVLVGRLFIHGLYLNRPEAAKLPF